MAGVCLSSGLMAGFVEAFYTDQCGRERERAIYIYIYMCVCVHVYDLYIDRTSCKTNRIMIQAIQLFTVSYK